ncbi:uncharacterized protein LOC135143517 [Zophobas morio]|uniref:uncharacterized protein LOC135143517 n=1 Tax=Zophobas morio TaxID=2755281 RepID=UPI00308368F0
MYMSAPLFVIRLLLQQLLLKFNEAFPVLWLKTTLEAHQATFLFSLTITSRIGLPNLLEWLNLTLEFHLVGCNLRDDDVKHLNYLSNVRYLDLSSNFIKDAGIKHLTRPLLYKRRTLQSLRLLHVLDVSDNPVSHRCITSLVCFEKLLYFAISYKKGAKKLWCKIAKENFGFVRTKVTNSAKLFFRKELKKSLLEPLPLLEGIPENFYIDNSDSNWPILTTRKLHSCFEEEFNNISRRLIFSKTRKPTQNVFSARPLRGLKGKDLESDTEEDDGLLKQIVADVHRKYRVRSGRLGSSSPQQGYSYLQ